MLGMAEVRQIGYTRLLYGACLARVATRANLLLGKIVIGDFGACRCRSMADKAGELQAKVCFVRERLRQCDAGEQGDCKQQPPEVRSYLPL